MYCYLGIVAQEDLTNGIIEPSYILCQSHGKSEARSGWRVMRQDDSNVFRNMNKVLVKSIIGNDQMIHFLCNYRTRDHPHNDKKHKYEETKKYYPIGALFWFQCDEYGEPNGAAIFIQKIPVKHSGRTTDDGFQKLKVARNIIPSLKEILTQEPQYEINESTNIKPRLAQRR